MMFKLLGWYEGLIAGFAVRHWWATLVFGFLILWGPLAFHRSVIRLGSIEKRAR